MGLRKRLGAAFRAFVNPGLRQPRSVPPPDPERVVVDRLLAGRNALVTGAGGTVGRGIALELAAHGANVYCTELDEGRAAALSTDLERRPVSSRVLRADITREADSDEVCRALASSGVTVDLLVNNVGISKGPAREMFATNVLGPMYLTDLVSRAMREAGGPASILFITSIHVETVLFSPAYSASKSALTMLIRELAVQLAPHRIRVNGIAPGWVAEDAEGRPLRHEWAPLEGTSLTPRHVGRAAVFLASDYFSRYTTGTVVTVDGGLSLFNYMSAIDAGLQL